MFDGFITVNYVAMSLAMKHDMPYGDVVAEALDYFCWALTERQDGRLICSVAAKTVVDDCLITEFEKGSNGYLYETPILAKIGQDADEEGVVVAERVDQSGRIVQVIRSRDPHSPAWTYRSVEKTSAVTPSADDIIYRKIF